jgi:hypothetical protein
MIVHEERILSTGKEYRGRSPLPGFAVSPRTLLFATEGGVRNKIKKLRKNFIWMNTNKEEMNYAYSSSGR